MGWTGIPNYGQFSSMKEKIEHLVESKEYKVLEYSCIKFQFVMVAVEAVNTGAIEVFELQVCTTEDEIQAKESSCGTWFDVCPKKMIPYLERANDRASIKLLEKTKEKEALKKQRVKLKSGHYYFLREGMPLSNGETAYIFKFHNRKLHTLNYVIDGGLRCRDNLVPVERIPQIPSLPEWLFTEFIGVLPGGRAVFRTCTDVSGKIEGSLHKDELVEIHNDFVKGIGDYVFTVENELDLQPHEVLNTLSDDVLTERLSQHRKALVRRKKEQAAIFNVFSNDVDYGAKEGSEADAKEMASKNGACIAKNKNRRETQLTLF